MAKITGDVNLTKIKARIRESVVDAMEEVGTRAMVLIREELQSGARSGVLAPLDGRPHRASAPGEPPANWTGALAASLDYEVDADGAGVRVFAEEPYASYLEYGTLNMAPRPFIGPVMERLAPDIQDIVSRAFDTKTGTRK